MDLHADFTLGVMERRLIVDDHAHDVSVKDMNLSAGPDDHVVFVPVSVVDKSDEFLGIADAADDLRFDSGPDAGDLSA